MPSCPTAMALRARSAALFSMRKPTVVEEAAEGGLVAQGVAERGGDEAAPLELGLLLAAQ